MPDMLARLPSLPLQKRPLDSLVKPLLSQMLRQPELLKGQQGREEQEQKLEDMRWV